MCDLSQSEVEGVISHYGWSGGWNDVEPFVSYPFDCSKYGDLCADLGMSNAQEFICSRWDDARAHEPEATIAARALVEWNALEDDWFDERFPDGVSGSHPWWGDVTPHGVTPPPSSCSAKETEENSGGDRRVRTKAGYTFTFVYNDVFVGAKAMKKVCVLGFCGWKKIPDASVSVNATFEGEDNTDGSLCTSAKSKSDSDGGVRVSEYFFGIMNWWEWSTGVGSSSTLSLTTEEACKRSPWDFAGC